MSWSFVLNPGGDITARVDVMSITRERRLFTELRPNVNRLAFRCTFDQTLFATLIANDTVGITVTKNGSAYFAGYLSPNYRAVIRDGIKYMEIIAEDPTLQLLGTTIADPVAWAGYAICNPSSTSTSLVHVIAAAAGVTLASGLPTISQTVPYEVVLPDDKKTWGQLLEAILFECSHVHLFNESGQLQIVPAVNSGPITTTATLTTAAGSANIRGELEISKSPVKYDDIRINYNLVESKTGIVLYQDTSGRDETNEANIVLEATGNAEGKDYYPLTSKLGEVFATWNSPDGFDVWVATSAALDATFETGITLSLALTNYYRKASFAYRNTAAAQKKITKLRITGNAYVVVSKNTARSSTTGGKLLLEHQAEHIFDDTSAQTLARLLAQYYAYSDLKIKARSATVLTLGQYVQVTDAIHAGLSVSCRVIGMVESEASPGGVITYDLEEVKNYIARSIDVGGNSRPVNSSRYTVEQSETSAAIIDLGLNTDGTVRQPIDSNNFASDITPTGDGLYLTQSYIGLRKTGAWKSYIDSDGLFAFSGDADNYVNWNGTKLLIKGQLTLDGDSLITGTISAGNTVKSSNYAAGSAGWQIEGSGAAEFSSATIRGTIHASAGTFGGTTHGWTIETGYLTALGTGKIRTGSTDTRAELDSTGLKAYQAGTVRAQILSDGSGYLGASSTLAWTTAGVVTAAGFTVDGTDGLYAGTGATRVQMKAGSGIWTGATAIGDAPFSVSNAGSIKAISGKVGAVSLASDSLYIGVGTWNSDDTPFYVNIHGKFSLGSKLDWDPTATTPTLMIDGIINSSGGAIGGWKIYDKKLSSALDESTNRIELNKEKNRVSIFSTSSEKVAMGYLNELLKNGPAFDVTKAYILNDRVLYNGIVYRCKLTGGTAGTLPTNTTYWEVSTVAYTTQDYGFWVAPGDTVHVDGPMEILNGDMTAHDASFSVHSGGSEIIRLGSDIGSQGLHFYTNDIHKKITPATRGFYFYGDDTSYLSVQFSDTTYCSFTTNITTAILFNKEVRVTGSIRASVDMYATTFYGAFNDYYQSGRDFPAGTLIRTAIDYSVVDGAPWVLEIKGNAYGRISPLNFKYQGYIYGGTIINHGGTTGGSLNLGGLVAFNESGKLCFWFPSMGYWEGYNVRVYIAYGTYPTNQVVSVINSAKPGGITKEVALSNIRGFYVDSSGNSYLNYYSGQGTIFGNGAGGEVARINPAGILTISNNLYLRSTSSAWSEGIRIDSGDNEWSGIMITRGLTGYGSTPTDAWAIGFTTTAISPEGALSFYNRNRDDASSAVAMTITKGRNVGIGTTSPEYALDIYKPASYYQLRIKSDGAPLIKFSGSYNGGNGAELYQNTDGNLVYNPNSSVNVMTISPGGAVGFMGKNFIKTSDTYLRINEDLGFTNGIWFGTSNLQASNVVLALGSNGTESTARVRIIGGSYNGSNVIKIDGTDGSITVSGKAPAAIGMIYFQLPGEAPPYDIFTGTWEYQVWDSMFFRGAQSTGSAKSFAHSTKVVSSATTTSIIFTTDHYASIGDWIKFGTQWRQISIINIPNQVTVSSAFVGTPSGTLVIAQGSALQTHKHKDGPYYATVIPGQYGSETGATSINVQDRGSDNTNRLYTSTPIADGSYKLTTDTSETRPPNVSIQVWKRTS
jgi:hypothetical protein